MKLSIIALPIALVLTGCASMGDPYIDVKLGIKAHETDLSHAVDCNSGVEAELELGFVKDLEFIKGELSYGMKHLSDLICGQPFRSGVEYASEKAFIGYRYRFKL